MWSIGSQEKSEITLIFVKNRNCCHQMSDFQVECTKFDFRWLSLLGDAPPDSLAKLKGRMGGKGKGGLGWRGKKGWDVN